jgi:hypothetical protein
VVVVVDLEIEMSATTAPVATTRSAGAHVRR